MASGADGGEDRPRLPVVVLHRNEVGGQGEEANAGDEPGEAADGADVTLEGVGDAVGGGVLGKVQDILLLQFCKLHSLVRGGWVRLPTSFFSLVDEQEVN